jgi:peptidylprolyl isomerase
MDEGVTGMRIGGLRQVVIPPSLAYGGRRVGEVPPNSILVFLIDLKTVQ